MLRGMSSWAHFEALDEGVLLVSLDPRYTQVGFNLIYVQVCEFFLPVPDRLFGHVSQDKVLVGSGITIHAAQTWKIASGF